MPTNLERVQRMRTWAAAQQQLTLARRIEIALISARADLDYETPSQIAADVFPPGFDIEQLNGHPDPQIRWIYYKLKNDDPAYQVGLNLPEEDGLELTHAIFWAADFGKDLLTSQEAVDRLTTLIPTETNLEVKFEYYLCLVMLGQPLTQNQLSEIENVFDAETWNTTDDHLNTICAFIFSLLI